MVASTKPLRANESRYGFKELIPRSPTSKGEPWHRSESGR